MSEYKVNLNSDENAVDAFIKTIHFIGTVQANLTAVRNNVNTVVEDFSKRI